LDNASTKTWWSKELADHLGIGGSTLRKWSMELEKAGYKFLRDEHGRRAYVEHDALAFRQFKKYLDSKMTYDSAATTVAVEYLRSESAEITLYANDVLPQEQQPNNERYEELNSKMDTIIKQNQELFMLLAAGEEKEKEKRSSWWPWPRKK
jgi:hypothetical protein